MRDDGLRIVGEGNSFAWAGRRCYDDGERVLKDWTMIYYYLYMGLLIAALVLWAIIAVYEDPEDGGGEPEDKA